ncbi:hypothetical protein ARHIZOSPH14_02460 [Agromyces rhizosphaerae]|uniref:Uncharacterized protein n=1 Tax=Agromyces rhizosphaerae TaxID=88374 RepID=A0A9W6CVC0_9MICO|nr:hypothetical protein [Agromyces rhizosphaerae]GLI26004.1 hypothetical protein ARHIZOSPH14_02460 [Agromyces rhizosphaerae]
MSRTTGGGGREDQLREALRRGAADAGAPAIDADAVAARGEGIRRARRRGWAAGAAGVLAVSALGGVVWATLPGSGDGTIAASAPDERAEEESAGGEDLLAADESGASEAAVDACGADAVGPAPDLVVSGALSDALDSDAPVVVGEVELRNDADALLAGEAELRVELLGADGELIAAGVADAAPLDLDAGGTASFDIETVPVRCGAEAIAAATEVRVRVLVHLADGTAVLAATGPAEPVRVD